MSRFEINPDTREPFVQEPVIQAERIDGDRTRRSRHPEERSTLAAGGGQRTTERGNMPTADLRGTPQRNST